MFTQSDGIPAGLVRALYLDHAGRLWVATGQRGVARLDDPQAEHPHFVVYTTADGLASNGVSCITEDNLGRMYFGTARSLDHSTCRLNASGTTPGPMGCQAIDHSWLS